MFLNKKKEKRFYKDCLEIYYEEIKDSIKNKNDHYDILKLKNKIKEDYIEKINKNELDIISEKIRLEHNVGKYITPYMNSIINFSVALFSGIFILYFQSSNIFDIKINFLPQLVVSIITPIIRMLIFLGLIYYVSKIIVNKPDEKNKLILLINNISLKVIEEIEREDQNLARTEVAAASTAISNINLNIYDTNPIILKDSVNGYTFWKLKKRYNQLLRKRFGEKFKIKTEERVEQKLMEELHDKLNEAYSIIVKDKETYEREKAIIKSKIAYKQESSFQSLVPVYAIVFTLIFNLITFSQKIYEILKLNDNDYIRLLVSFIIIVITALYFLYSLNKDQFKKATQISFYNLSLDIIEKVYEKNDFNNKNKESD
ncbi:hypothetical protein [Clostridium sp.]|uniref:hypothetical protein n=1 Tax=Clostridium sp. TaxID=1506 RepID=UPI002849499E|nr:hypothetical protein [Clostridium sp.]MDR3595043.1 hypothetical protein [Clostridium sp.]